jgi:hypothetical protein
MRHTTVARDEGRARRVDHLSHGSRTRRVRPTLSLVDDMSAKLTTATRSMATSGTADKEREAIVTVW